MTLLTYLLAFLHFASELVIFRTAKFGPGALSPVVVSSESTPVGAPAKDPAIADRVTLAVSLTWMFLQYDFYVQ
jgi:hypothetical protein